MLIRALPGCVRLRRPIWRVLLLSTPAVVFVATFVFLVVYGVWTGEEWAVWVGVICLLVMVGASMSAGYWICGGDLVRRNGFWMQRRIPISSIESLTLARCTAPGPVGYKSWTVLVEVEVREWSQWTGYDRRAPLCLVYGSLMGRKRPRVWMDMIASHPDFRGDVRESRDFVSGWGRF